MEFHGVSHATAEEARNLAEIRQRSVVERAYGERVAAQRGEFHRRYTEFIQEYLRVKGLDPKRMSRHQLNTMRYLARVYSRKARTPLGVLRLPGS